MSMVTGARRRIRFGVLAWVFASGCTLSGNIDVDMPVGEFRSDHYTIQVVSTLIGGKNVFVPSTIVVTSGAAYTLSIFNTTDTPHGFRIRGLGIEAILPSREEHRIELPPLEGGNIYSINCHLHPPHRTAELVVLPGRDSGN